MNNQSIWNFKSPLKKPNTEEQRNRGARERNSLFLRFSALFQQGHFKRPLTLSAK